MTNESAMTASMRSSAAPHLPGDSAVWIFVIGDMVIFSAYFAAYMFDRGQNHGLFLQSQQHLNQSLGFVNTLILLTSSLFAALSVQATRNHDVKSAFKLLTLGGACGVAFVAIKAFEWAMKLQQGLTVSTDSFFMHYYMMTGLHCAHVLLGLIILVIAGRELRIKSAPRVHILEVAATYWHMVDFLWIMIFALLYLMR
jgi:nitric oxide reductase NorE protein